jgi:hypothetical protein
LDKVLAIVAVIAGLAAVAGALYLVFILKDTVPS